jgi:hypothetical protein
VLERAIIGSLGSCREKACGQFPAPDVVVEAIATYAFARAGFIGAVAFVAVAILFTIHELFSFKIWLPDIRVL